MLSNHRLPYPRLVDCSLATKQQSRCYPRIYIKRHIKRCWLNPIPFAAPPRITSADCQACASRIGYILMHCHYPQLLRRASRTWNVFGLIRRCISDTAETKLWLSKAFASARTLFTLKTDPKERQTGLQTTVIPYQMMK